MSAPTFAERLISERDMHWVRAMADALGMDSGYEVPIVPEPESFRRLFEAVRARAVAEAAGLAKPAEGFGNAR